MVCIVAAYSDFACGSNISLQGFPLDIATLLNEFIQEERTLVDKEKKALVVLIEVRLPFLNIERQGKPIKEYNEIVHAKIWNL